ncbi:MAG: hypothetical protein ACD_42C00272G0001 [uncultured bacterium]|nr:MAG: hypothetical protein ACD_42C00272G0001 [uncultured bacterium]
MAHSINVGSSPICCKRETIRTIFFEFFFVMASDKSKIVKRAWSANTDMSCVLLISVCGNNSDSFSIICCAANKLPSQPAAMMVAISMDNITPDFLARSIIHFGNALTSIGCIGIKIPYFLMTASHIDFCWVSVNFSVVMISTRSVIVPSR